MFIKVLFSFLQIHGTERKCWCEIRDYFYYMYKIFIVLKNQIHDGL